jgi:hypothetical protein
MDGIFMPVQSDYLKLSACEAQALLGHFKPIDGEEVPQNSV